MGKENMLQTRILHINFFLPWIWLFGTYMYIWLVCYEQVSLLLTLPVSIHFKIFFLYTQKYETTTGRFQKYASVWLSFTVPPLTCKNLSILQDECSGPAPSIPWGNSITSPVCRSHFTTSTEVKHLFVWKQCRSDKGLVYQSNFSDAKKGF